MAHSVREATEALEEQFLSVYAMPSRVSVGRPKAEEPDPVRTCYQRDRDRVLHSKAFRRLSGKTQVFIAPEGDHYRTRLTHSLEVSQIARTITRALRLNEDLAEAIALAHDLGHPPFGHIGEKALDDAAKAHFRAGDPDGFRHFEQSLRIVDVLEAMNLSEETRAGIGGHSKGRKDLSAYDGEPTSTLEAAVVRISDRIAYMNHDLDDAMRSGLVKTPPKRFLELGATHSRRIGAMVNDAIENSREKPSIQLSPEMLGAMNELKDWLFENVYLRYPQLVPDAAKAELLVRDLFESFRQTNGVRGALDYVAGMTDRFAIATFERLRLPGSFAGLAEDPS